MLWIVISIVSSYLIGSIPTAYIAVKLVKGLDIRKFGSGNVGATNTFRVLGKGWGMLVLFIDILKGVIPVTLLAGFFLSKNIFIPDNAFRLILGIVSVCGHNWTLFLNFKGGKGVAATLGVLIGLALTIPGLKIILGLTLITWIALFLLFRRVSVASISVGISLPMYMILFKQSKEFLVTGIILCLFIIWRHKPNIIKLLQGKEEPINLFSRKKSS